MNNTRLFLLFFAILVGCGRDHVRDDYSIEAQQGEGCDRGSDTNYAELSIVPKERGGDDNSLPVVAPQHEGEISNDKHPIALNPSSDLLTEEVRAIESEESSIGSTSGVQVQTDDSQTVQTKSMHLLSGLGASLTALLSFLGIKYIRGGSQGPENKNFLQRQLEKFERERQRQLEDLDEKGKKSLANIEEQSQERQKHIAEKFQKQKEKQRKEYLQKEKLLRQKEKQRKEYHYTITEKSRVQEEERAIEQKTAESRIKLLVKQKIEGIKNYDETTKTQFDEWKQWNKDMKEKIPDWVDHENSGAKLSKRLKEGREELIKKLFGANHAAEFLASEAELDKIRASEVYKELEKEIENPQSQADWLECYTPMLVTCKGDFKGVREHLKARLVVYKDKGFSAEALREAEIYFNAIF